MKINNIDLGWFILTFLALIAGSIAINCGSILFAYYYGGAAIILSQLIRKD